jgi:dienelactone hydrolase
LLGLSLAAADTTAKSAQADKSWLAIPFLEIFNARDADPAISESSVAIPAGGRSISGFLVRPIVAGRLPALLLLSGGGEIPDWLRQSAREIASTGFVALAPAYDPEGLGSNSTLVQAVAGDQLGTNVDAALSWLASQAFVDAQRVGAAGWGEEGAEQVLRLAQRGKIQGGVVADTAACNNPDRWLQVRAVPLLIIQGAGSCTAAKAAALQQMFARAQLPHALHLYPGVSGSFLQSTAAPGPAAAADRAWVDIYEFLAKNVEDTNPAAVPASSQPQNEIARIVDIMRVINADDGVRGELARSLAALPAGNAQWERARSQAAVLAEAGNLLLERRPPKGSLTGWRERAAEFRSAAQAVLRAVEQRDFPAAQEALRRLPQACAACHADYR